MIIKSMSRKVPSFGQLLGYIDRDEGQEDFAIRHNLLGRNADAVRAEFERNAELLQKRRNGTYLFHEIISITRAKDLSPDEQKQRLHEIALEYISARCPGNLVYGGLHQDKDHSYHMHLMISANRAGEKKRQRLTKHQFREIQVKLEAHVLQTYPELEQKLAIGKKSDRGRTKKEAELERRTGKRPIREEILARVQFAYDASQDRDSLLAALGREGLELYVRGKTIGVTDLETGKNHRLKTLDLQVADQMEIRLAGQEVEIQSERENASAGEKEKEANRPGEETEAEADNRDYVNYDSNADLKPEPNSQQDPEVAAAQTNRSKAKPKKEQSMPDPEDREQDQESDTPDWAIKAAEKSAGGKGKSPWDNLVEMAKKVAEQGVHEAKVVGKLARRGLLGDENEKQFEVDEPEAPTKKDGSDQQAKWREDIKRTRGAEKEGPDQGRE